jgi:hypothetical protein
MRLAFVAAALLVSSEAFAGGFGITATGGMRTDRVFFYDSSQNDAEFAQTQLAANYGAGLEFLLGDRDDRINGVFRGYWLQDAPQKNPADMVKDGEVVHADVTGSEPVSPDDVVANVRDDPRNVGAASFGVQWGLVGNPTKNQLVLMTALGAGFITTDHTEFAMAQGGVGGTFTIAHDFQAFADLEYTLRYRKGFSQGVNAWVGMRYLFD